MKHAEWMDRAERRYWKLLARRHKENVTAIARDAGVNRGTVYKKLQKFEISIGRPIGKTFGNLAWQQLAR